MPRIKFVSSSAVETEVDVPVGYSVMESALHHGISGITGDCGGACACATCSIRIDDNWADRAGGPSELEMALLEYSAAADLGGVSRLACQVKMTEDLDGLTVHLPEQQL